MKAVTDFQVGMLRSAMVELQRWEKDYGAAIKPKDAQLAVMGKGFGVGQTIATLNHILTDLERERE